MIRTVDDIQRFLECLPKPIATILEGKDLSQLIEIAIDLGRTPEARFFNGSRLLAAPITTQEDLDRCCERIGAFGGDNRAGISGTLHRISAIRSRTGQVVGLTCRVGRNVSGTITSIADLIGSGRSILLLGKPGIGKTTALREIAKTLADVHKKRVVIVDSSNEIAGDGNIPHPAIGRARRMQVASPELQHRVMIEAVENHTPEVLVIDEIGTEEEALAARTIAERGVQLIGTAHGIELINLVNNPTLSDLVGGIQSVTLGDDEARRRGCQKTILERKADPTFQIAIEMLERYKWNVHDPVAKAVDQLLKNQPLSPSTRTVKPENDREVKPDRKKRQRRRR